MGNKKTENQAEELKAEDVKAKDVKAEDVKAEDVKADEAKMDEAKAEDSPQPMGFVEPIGYAVRLKSIHPHASYWRCGYQFNKEADVEIANHALSCEQLRCLADDPYLELSPIVDE